MKKLTNISIFVVFILCSTICRAANDSTIVHNFSDLITAGKLNLVKPYTEGPVTDGITYTCSGNVTFGSYSAQICLNFTGRGDTVTTSLIRNLRQVRLYYLPENAIAASSLKIRLSTDGVNWSEPLTTTSGTESGSTTITFDPCDYYVKICTSSNKAFSIPEIDYWLSRDFCNCFPYAP